MGLTVACSPPGFRGALPAAGDIRITDLAVTDDGRFVALDYFIWKGEGALASGKGIAVYDLRTQGVRILAHPGPYQYLSPSFSSDGRHMVYIQFCWDERCEPQELGHQLAVFNLDDGTRTLLTDGQRKLPIVVCCHREIAPVLPYRSSPSFSPDGAEIFYFAGERMCREFHPGCPQWDVQGTGGLQGMRMSLGTRGEQPLFAQDGIYGFFSADRMEPAGPGKLLFRANGTLARSDQAKASLGSQYFAVYFDLESGAFADFAADWPAQQLRIDGAPRLTLAADLDAMDRIAGAVIERENHSARRLVHASADGGRVVFSAVSTVLEADGDQERMRNVVFVKDGPEFGILLARPERCSASPTALSPNGRWLVLEASCAYEPDTFWLVDLDNDSVEAIPLDPVKAADRAMFAPPT